MKRIGLIKMDEEREARISLAPGEISPNHYHSSVVEEVFCLSGEIDIVIAGNKKRLVPGGACKIEPLVSHYLMNPSTGKAEYLLRQKGVYDFVHINS